MKNKAFAVISLLTSLQFSSEAMAGFQRVDAQKVHTGIVSDKSITALENFLFLRGQDSFDFSRDKKYFEHFINIRSGEIHSSERIIRLKAESDYVTDDLLMLGGLSHNFLVAGPSASDVNPKSPTFNKQACTVLNAQTQKVEQYFFEFPGLNSGVANLECFITPKIEGRSQYIVANRLNHFAKMNLETKEITNFNGAHIGVSPRAIGTAIRTIIHPTKPLIISSQNELTVLNYETNETKVAQLKHPRESIFDISLDSSGDKLLVTTIDSKGVISYASADNGFGVLNLNSLQWDYLSQSAVNVINVTDVKRVSSPILLPQNTLIYITDLNSDSDLVVRKVQLKDDHLLEETRALAEFQLSTNSRHKLIDAKASQNGRFLALTLEDIRIDDLKDGDHKVVIFDTEKFEIVSQIVETNLEKKASLLNSKALYLSDDGLLMTRGDLSFDQRTFELSTWKVQ